MSLKRGRATGWIVAIVAAVFLLLALSCTGAVLWRFYLGPDDDNKPAVIAAVNVDPGKPDPPKQIEAPGPDIDKPGPLPKVIPLPAPDPAKDKSDEVAIPQEVEKVGWSYVADPGPPLGRPVNPGNVLDFVGSPRIVFPSTPSPYVAVRHGKSGNESWQIFNLESGKQTGRIPGNLELDLAALSPDGRFLAGIARKGDGKHAVVKVYSAEDGKLVRSFSVDIDAFGLRRIDFLEDNHVLTCKQFDHKTHFGAYFEIWNSEGQRTQDIMFKGGNVDRGRMCLSPGRKYLAIATSERWDTVHIFRAKDGKKVGLLRLPNLVAGVSGSVHAMAFSPDGHELAVCADFLLTSWLQLAVFRLDKGELAVQHIYRGTFDSLAKTSLSVYKGSLLEWLPDKSGLLLHSQVIIDSVSGVPACDLGWPAKESSFNPRRFIGADHFVSTVKVAQGARLEYSARPRPLRDVGADSGWMGIDELGNLSFSPSPLDAKALTDIVPAFRFTKPTQGILARLPSRAVLGLDLSLNTELTDAGLKELAALKSLQLLRLGGSLVTGAGLKELAALKNLRALDLVGTGVTDATLKPLAALQELRVLHLGLTAVTDAGLKELATLKRLESLNLGGTSVTGVGLGELAALKSLQTLTLRNTKMTDAELTNLAALKSLQSLDLGYTAVTDAGLSHLATLTGLETLNLEGTRVTDAGLKELTRLKNLRTLNLAATQVTDAGLTELAPLRNLQRLGLATTKVTDGGLKELAPLKNLRVLNLVRCNVTAAGMRHLAALTSLQTLRLVGTPITGAGLNELARLKNLQSLDLNSTPVTDAGLKELASLKSLRTLDLSDTRATDAGLKQLTALQNLRTLRLGGTKVTGAGLKELAALEHLQTLDVVTELTDADLKGLAALKGLQSISLGGDVTDAGLRQLTSLKELRLLRLYGTLVTESGVNEIRRALPQCWISR
jgi:Leucine-rich repeat (LRR) protein